MALILALVLGLWPWSAAVAAPAYEGLQSYVQPDRTQVLYRLVGDETLHWKETPEGDVILLDRGDGYYHYAQLRNGKITPSEVRVASGKKPFVRLTRSQLLSISSYALRNSVAIEGLAQAPAFASAAGFDAGVAAPDPEQHLLVLLIEYNNIAMAGSEAFWSGRFFGTGADSLADYYDEVSKGGLSVLPAAETAGTAGDGVVRVSLPVDHPAAAGFDGHEEAVFEYIAMDIEAALDAAGPDLAGLSAYDADGNGILTQDEVHLVAVFAGYEKAAGEEDINAIWAHAMDYEGGGIGSLPGGLAFGGYQAVGENMWEGTPMTIGVFCHEFGHSLGLPDLYDYGYDSEGLGCVSLMAGGSWNYNYLDAAAEPGSSPAHPDAWCKAALGFATVIEANTGGEYLLKAAAGAEGNIVKIPGGSPGQYFLAELRTFTGYDTGLNGWLDQAGVAFYHVDENVIAFRQTYPEIGYWNDNKYRKAVDLEEANAGILGYNELDARINPYLWDGRLLFTASAGRNLLGPATNPGTGLYSQAVAYPFDELAASGTQGLASGNSLTVLGLDSTGARLRVALGSEKFVIDAIPDQTYTGLALQPALTVKAGATPLTKGVDYTAVYSKNTAPGKATVTVSGAGKYAGSSATASFVIVPKPLSSVTLNLSETYSVTGDRYRTIKASWAPATGASGYIVAYRASTATSWTFTKVTGTSFSKVLSAGTLYLVRVKPYIAITSTDLHYASAYSPEKSVYTLKTPTFSLAASGTQSVKVAWTNIYGETGYRIYRASSLTGTYSLKAVVSGAYSSWTDTTTYHGKTYYYKIRAYKTVNGVLIYGSLSAAKKIVR